MMDGFLPTNLVFKRILFFLMLWVSLAFFGLITLKTYATKPIKATNVEAFMDKNQNVEKIYSTKGTVLDLAPLAFSLEMPDLSHELRVMKVSVRPDKEFQKEEFLLELHSKDKKKLQLDEKTYLTYDNDSYVFSTKPTPLSLSVTKDWDHYVNTELVVKPEEIYGATIQYQKKNIKLPLQQEPYADMANLQQDEAFSWLAGAQWWSPDLVFQFLGNKDQKILGNKQRLKILCLDVSYQCIFDENDWLYWKDEKWKVTSDIKEAKNCPLARIKSLAQKELEIEGWDAEGKEKYVFLLIHQPIENLTIKPEELLKSLRLKTKKQVTFQIDKQMLSLRIGDAFYRADKDQWKIVKNFRCLPKQMKEIEGKSLFVFEKIQLEEGKKVFKGHFFNEMHTHMMPIELPIQRAGIKGPNYLEKNHMPHEKPSHSGR